MTAAILTALLSYWKRRPAQFAALVLGLALATALWSGVQAINAEARKSYDAAADVLGGGGLRNLVDPKGLISQDTFVRLRRGGWQVSPVVDGWLTTAEGRVRILGIDPFTAPRDGTFGAAAETGNLAGLTGPDAQVFSNTQTAERLANTGVPLQIDDSVAPGMAIADLRTASRLTGKTGYDRLILLPDQPLKQTPLADLAPDLTIEAPATADDIGRLTDSFHLNLTAFGLLSFAVGLFIVHGAIGLAFEQRRPMFRTLRALGVSSRTLVVILMAELLLFALAAGALGILLGYLIAGALLPGVAATLRGIYGATVEGGLTLSPVWWLSGLGIAVLGTALAALSSLYQVARMPPLAPAKPRAWERASQGAIRWQTLAACACFTLSALAYLAGGGLVAGFTLLGSFLLGAALLLPGILLGIIRFASAGARTAETEWFWADTRQQVPGLALALMALLLALSANIGVGTMVSSFRDTFTGWLDQRLVSELYVTVETKDQARALEDFVTKAGGTVLPIWHTDGQIKGAPAEIYGVVDNAVYRGNWPLLASLPDAWDRLAANQGALVNEQLARREDLTPGDMLAMPGGWETPIVGVYSDYGNPLAQVVIPLATLTQRFEALDQSDFGILTDDIPAMRRGLRDTVGLDEARMIDQSALKAFSLDIFERTFAVTAALNVLTLSVAGLAILTSLLTLSAMRLPQLAPVWAIGMTRKRLAWLELIRALALAALTFVLALPVGLMLAWILLAVINVEAFGWRLPMSLFPKDWVWLALASLGAATLAAIWPARQLAKRPPADLIKVFSHER